MSSDGSPYAGLSSASFSGTPFTGTPIALPGRIQAIYYDNGGEGVAYHDTTSTNDGGAYRSDGVDICNCGSTSSNSVGWTQPDEWLEYTVNVAASGTYTFQAVTATVVDGTGLHIEVDGVNVTGQMALPNTGSWGNFVATSKAGVMLSAGQHVVRVVIDGGGFIFDSVNVVVPPAPTAPSGLTAATASASQIDLTWADNSVDETGFKVERKTGAGGTYTQVGTVGAGVTSFASTGLTPNTLYYYRVRATNLGGDSAYSGEASATTSNAPPTVSLTSPANGAVSTAPAAITLTAAASDEGGTVTKVEFFQAATKLGEATSAPYTFAWTNVPAGSYTLTAKATDNAGAHATSSAVTVTVNQLGQIHGKITKVDGVTPVAGVVVKVLHASGVVGTAITNGAGDYAVADLDDGTYTVEASAPEYITKVQGGIAINGSSTVSLNLSLGAAISYLYDDLGRLTGVIDATGATANYTYDAVGNLLSITRGSSTQTSISGFTPSGGAVGTSVVIRGTGFGASAGDNAVSFNNVAATVISSTPTSIKVVVPAGATTGAISVTSPNGTALSGTHFNVSASNEPTITGFTPSIGSVGTNVTVSGTNFETVPTDNRVRVNLTRGLIVSSAATSLTAKVAAETASGRISIATPAGTAVSSGDFFVAPAPYVAADVAATARVSVGQSANFAVNTPHKIGLLIFDGVAGQKVSLVLSNLTASATTRVHAPNGLGLAQGNFIDALTLPTTGTYTIMFDPDGASTGGATFTLYDVTDITSPITAGGPAASATVNTPGQNITLPFNGTAGQRVSLNFNSTFPHIPYQPAALTLVRIVKADGTVVGHVSANGVPTDFLETVTLPTTGAYFVSYDPYGTSTGTMTFNLYDVPADVTGTITPGGPAVTAGTSIPGQNIRLTFDGTAGQKVSVVDTPGAGTSTWPYIYIYKPDGTVLSWSTSTFLDATTLPTSGTYTLLADPQGANTGSQAFTLHSFTDVTGTLTVGGASVTSTVSVPGQNIRLTFGGTTGQQVNLSVSGNTFPFIPYAGIYATHVKVLKPDGTELTVIGTNGQSSTSSGTLTLPADGTYTVIYDSHQMHTGSMTFALSSVP